MTEQELCELIAHHEANRVELTASKTDTDQFAEAVCAFANDLPHHRKPGYLVVGIRDDCTFAGIQVDDLLLRNLAGLRDDGNIQPLPAITVEKVETRDGEAAVVKVQPALLPPVR
jgi:ATP-dependent DNA helicase RecG